MLLPSNEVIRKQLLNFAETIQPQDLFPTLETEASLLVSQNPFAFILAVSLDRGTKAEIIWTIPYWIHQKLGHLDPCILARMSREEIESILQGMNHQESVPERINLIGAAKYLVVKKSTMYKLTMTRKIPFSKFGRKIIFYTKELDEWIKQNGIRVKTREEIEREASEYIMLGARKKLNRKFK